MKELNKEDLKYAEMCLIFNGHPDIFKTMDDTDKIYVANLIDTYLNLNKGKKKELLEIYVKELTYEEFKRKSDIIKDNNYEEFFDKKVLEFY